MACGGVAILLHIAQYLLPILYVNIHHPRECRLTPCTAILEHVILLAIKMSDARESSRCNNIQEHLPRWRLSVLRHRTKPTAFWTRPSLSYAKFRSALQCLKWAFGPQNVESIGDLLRRTNVHNMGFPLLDIFSAKMVLNVNVLHPTGAGRVRCGVNSPFVVFRDCLPHLEEEGLQ